MKKSTKKQLTAAILAGVTLAVAAPAMAANPFSDVPAKHWAYDSVSKLAAAGIVDGYGDGTFRGDRTLTRYEMAQMVAKAMAHEDKANAEQKAMIDKLAQEFSDELDNLGVRVSNLEKKIGNITWSGQVREWYQWKDTDVAGDHTDLNTRLLLFMNAPMNDNITFHGRLWAESAWGDGTHASQTGADVSMDQAYLEGKYGNTTWTLGRQGIQLGQGLIYAWFANNDGATVTFGGDNTKLTLAAFKNNDFALANATDLNIVAAQLTQKAGQDLDLTLAYAKNEEADTGTEMINSYALGAVYRGIDNLTVTGEYGINKSDNAKAFNANDDAKAWIAQIKYKGAQWAKPHTFGIWAGYRDADRGFFGRTGDYVWETATSLQGGDYGYCLDNLKGANYGFDYTVFNNAIFTFEYFDLERDTNFDATTKDQKGLVAQLRYQF